MDQQIIMLELNEVNFEFVRCYGQEGKLPHFHAFLEKHGCVETTSEQRYEELEPWIQWVTAHTGLSLCEHQIFRLGDIVHSDIEQIWEQLARQGVSVGAISPMNAKCRGDKWDFFVPDPWTRTEIVAPPHVKRMYDGISQIVNDNAQDRVLPTSLVHLAIGCALTARPVNYLLYLRYAQSALKKPWFKAIFLDQLLSDLFIRSVAKRGTRFSSLFLNAAAHIQHHYMFSSPLYRGSKRNPEWYIDRENDPVLDVYSAYDSILGNMIKRFPEARIMLATALHQDPYHELAFYWRLKDHATFLRRLGLDFQSIEPRMSRDFLILFNDEDAARRGERILSNAVADDNIRLFEIDNRGKDLFVMLTYPHDVNKLSGYRVGNRHYTGLANDVAFVAIKNGEHNGIGYFSDSGLMAEEQTLGFPLRTLPQYIASALNVPA